MDQVKTGKLIRSLRLKHHLTQLALAEMLGVSDKAVSKWERGCGAPDISLLPLLSQALGADTEVLLRGVEEISRVGAFNNLPSIHHHYPIGHLADDSHIVRDEPKCSLLFAAEGTQQLENLVLNHDIQRGGRLVGNQQFRAKGQCHSNHDALFHPSGHGLLF